MPFSEDPPPGLKRGCSPSRAGVETGEHAREERPGHQLERGLRIEVTADVAAGLSALDDRSHDRAAREQDPLPKRVDQLGVTVLLCNQPADQSDIGRTIGGQALLNCPPQFRTGIAEIGRFERRQLMADHVRDQARLVGETAIDRGLADARCFRDRLDRHSREPVLDQQRKIWACEEPAFAEQNLVVLAKRVTKRSGIEKRRSRAAATVPVMDITIQPYPHTALKGSDCEDNDMQTIGWTL